MEHQFWHEKWEAKQIGFHEPEGNALLIKWFSRLGLQKGQRIFVPLCGKTRDIGWLLAQGCCVAGAELSEIAVRELFDELNMAPEVTELGELKIFSGPDIDIFVGDFFRLTEALLGHVDATYDRAALIALPTAMRTDYAKHLAEVTLGAPQLLITLVYDQSVMNGPPFSVDPTTVMELYTGRYEIDGLEQVDVPGGLKGRCEAQEHAWLLSAR